jgi:hypothetical protein
MRFSVDPWDPEYGVANELDRLDPTKGDVVIDIERPASAWEPLGPARRGGTEPVVFVDGVRRVEARVWLHEADGTARPAICASYAAGTVRCDGAARIESTQVERGLFTSSGSAQAVETVAGQFPVRLAAADTIEALALALQEHMGQGERKVAERATAQWPEDLIVVDGPLRGGQDLLPAVGYVKTHHVAYLPPEQHATIGRLDVEQRSPLFLLATSWSRLAWYFRLPGGSDAPWAGVVRGECRPDIPLPEAAALADRVTTSLQRFASEPYKEPRAPQNLYPIAGLERELRRRLGDPQLLYRALRRSARESAGAATPIR